MIAGLSGSLLSHDVVERVVREQPPAPSRSIRAWHASVSRSMGPADSARSVFDRLAVPLLQNLGFRVVPATSRSSGCLHAQLEADGRAVALLVVTGWGRDPSSAWRESVRLGIATKVRWCLCVTGPLLCVFDATRTYSRRHAQFDLESTVQDPGAFAALSALVHANAFTRAPQPVLDRLVLASEQFRAEVRTSLQDGVLEALRSLLGAFASAGRRGSRAASPDALLDESLIVVYRILFLLFAEARGLVPKWHPVFRDGYTIESLRGPVERRDRPAGLWESLQAIARLAHDGCHAGILRVPAFNGRLFSPSHAPLAESLTLDDAAVRSAMLSLTTRSGAQGRRRIAYADLGVEQLGGVYEGILDFSPAAVAGDRRRVTLVRAGRRKATGAFYTPRALTEFIVRRTLAPLVSGADSTRLLSLRILDPAMGSGAFLVAACRYLASAYEASLMREGAMSTFDVTESDRSSFRRTVAQRCLFGVDVNPMAVQLGRLSLWLASLAADRPLTFLDHHLRAGNSLVGASLADIARQPPARGRRRSAAPVPLFDANGFDSAMESVVAPRIALAIDPADTVAQIRAKEQLLVSLQHPDGPIARWRTVADLWCAEWFRRGRRLTPATFAALADRVLGRGSVLPARLTDSLLQEASERAQHERFFHWQLEFPEVFYDADGLPLASPGFDAVIGNPPWEMLRGDRAGCDDAAALTAFARESGVYRFQSDGHANLYQLFTERVLGLVRKGGRVGLVLPSGIAKDHGCAALRRAVFDATSIDTFVTIENRDGVFPIHRGLKFVLLAGTAGMSTRSIPSRTGIRSPEVLDRLPDADDGGAVLIPRPLLEQLSGDQHAVPDIRTADDLEIVSRIAFSVPPLTGEGGWNVTFGRELNATDDRCHFLAAPASRAACPIVEGKQIQPFVVDVAASRCVIRREDASRLLGASFTRARLAYRDVASASNRLTLIAAMLPPDVVSTHTLFCVKDDVDLEIQQFVCAIFNSFVANYLVRLRVNTHVTVAIVEKLPVPRPARDAAGFRSLVELSRRLSKTPDDGPTGARLQAIAAALYGCTDGEFHHILDSFPLVPAAERAAAFAELSEIRQIVRAT
jgi:hypothetical protein